MKYEIPSYVKPFLWSYDIDKLDIKNDARRIITNVLNSGTRHATDWIFQTFTTDEISEAILHPLPGEWNKKSLNFWSLMLDITHGPTAKILH